MKMNCNLTPSPRHAVNGMARLRLMLLCLVAMFTLTACGGSDDLTDDSKPDTGKTDDGGNTDGDDNQGGVTTYKPTKAGGLENEANEQNTPSGWTAVELPQLPTITDDNTLYITAYGATTDSKDNTKAVQAAFDAVPEAGGRVVVPPGEWLCGPVKMRSKTILYIADGATLKLLPLEGDNAYPYTTTGDGKRLYENFIDCNSNATDIIVEGESRTGSIIDGQGADWWHHVPKKGYEDLGLDTLYMKRGAVIRFSSGERFLIKNLTVQNAPGVNLTISNSGKASNGTIHSVTIKNPSSEGKATDWPNRSHNTDGIAVWGHHVNIYNCDISTGDDNVVVDSDGRYVHVWDCDFGDGHGASIGSYTVNVHDILYENIDFNGTESGFRLKSQRGKSGDVYNITCQNCTMKGVYNPVYIECWYDKSKKPVPQDAEAETLKETTPAFRDILLKNITSTGTPYNSSPKGYFPVYLYGLPESYINNVTFDNVQIEAQKGMFLAFCKGVTFQNGCKITNSKNANALISTSYEAEITGDYGKVETSVEGEEWSYTLDSDAAEAGGTASGSTTYTFSNGITITNNDGKGYGTGSDLSGSIKYSAKTYTVNLPDGVTVTSLTIKGYDNYTEKDAYIKEVNGESFGSSTYVFPATKEVKEYTITLSNPASGSFTFTPENKQICAIITLNGKKS